MIFESAIKPRQVWRKETPLPQGGRGLQCWFNYSSGYNSWSASSVIGQYNMIFPACTDKTLPGTSPDVGFLEHHTP